MSLAHQVEMLPGLLPKADDGADLAEDVLQRLFCLVKGNVSN
jgi:hypothetical protein